MSATGAFRGTPPNVIFDCSPAALRNLLAQLTGRPELLYR